MYKSEILLKVMIEFYKCLIFGMFSQLASMPGCDNKNLAIS